MTDTKTKLNNRTLQELKNYCKIYKHKYYGYSKYTRKQDLIEFMLNPREFQNAKITLKKLEFFNNEKLKKEKWYEIHTNEEKFKLMIPSYGMTWRLFDHPKNYHTDKRRIMTQKTTIINMLKKKNIKSINEIHLK